MKVLRYFLFLLISVSLFSCKENVDISQLESNRFWILNGGDNSISIINPISMEEEQHLFLDAPQNTFAHHIYPNSDYSEFAIAFPEYDFASGHGGLHNQPDRKWGGYIGVLNRTEKRLNKTIKASFANHNAVYSKDDQEIWTGLVSHNGLIEVYDAHNGQLKNQIKVNPDPHELILSKDGKYILVTCLESSFLTVIDTQAKKIIKEIKVDPFPTSVWYGRTDREVIVENSNRNSLNFVDLDRLQVTDHLDLDFAPGYTEFSDDGELWICSKDRDSLFVYKKTNDDWMQVSEITTGKSPHALRFLNGKVWLINLKNNNVEVYDQQSKQLIQKIRVGKEPNAILYVP